MQRNGAVSYTHLDVYKRQVLTNGDQNQMETYLIKEEMEHLAAFLQRCKESFATFYVAISRNDSPLLRQKNRLLKALCQQMQIPTTALSRIYFDEAKGEESYKTLCAINQGVSLDDKMLNYSPKRYFRSKEEMVELYDEDDL